jgi:hypothetical protein
MLRQFLYRALGAALVAVSLTGCGTTANTSLEASWGDPTLRGTKFKRILILSMGGDEFAQQYFQEDLAKAMTQRGVNAVASERFFTHRSPAEQARFKRAVEQSGADAVLFAHVVGVDSKAGQIPGLLVTPSGVPVATTYGLEGAIAQTFAPGAYERPVDYTLTTVLVETVLYELKGRKAMWSARTRTDNANQGDLKPAVAQFVGVVVGAMERDGLLAR